MKMMLTVTLLVCAMMALSSAAGNNVIVKRSTCPRGWTPFNGRCFIYFPTPMTWAEAEKHCLGLGGNLASVHSFQEHHVIQSMILIQTHSYPFTWLGGYDATQEGVWFWSDGTRFKINYWAPGEPNNQDNAHCLLMNFGVVMKMMLTVTLLVCAMMALSSAAGKNVIVKRSTCPRGWTALNGRCFIYVPTPMTWAEAEKHCLGLGGNLASVHSFQEHHVIQSMILIQTHSYPFTWLGGYDATQEGVWFWSDGTRFKINYWAPGEPNNHDNAHCLLMNFGDQKKFDDQPCSLRRSFVCAKKP
ncbi:type-2 ice-structuring protein-like [Chaetodon trifascialis]|uniref:type-2 ice-structuring protein-like n=1 Tax=Chaetodon trifascialis TaxID=109706 RepID=UPI0039911FD1